jgi:hypothetical protein
VNPLPASWQLVQLYYNPNLRIFIYTCVMARFNLFTCTMARQLALSQWLAEILVPLAQWLADVLAAVAQWHSGTVA